jgi:tRNA pseudouridine38-40 synthase
VIYRYFIRLAYNGIHFHGWQIQHNANTIQQLLNECFTIILEEEVKLTGTGRTDTGVHAKEFFAHFDVKTKIETSKIENMIFKLNSYLPDDVVIYDIFPVLPDAHARFDAISRTYQYFISLIKNPFEKEFSYYVYGYLNVKMMNKAAEMLLDYQDFSCFSKSKTQVKTNNCHIMEAYWKKEDNMLVFTIKADRFLRNMVRAIVGTLLDLGREKITIDDLRKIIEGKNRSDAGFSVPACGLFLTKIEYPTEIFLL